MEIPEADNVVATYPIAVIKATTNQAAGRGVQDYVLGPEGQAVLEGRRLPRPVTAAP